MLSKSQMTEEDIKLQFITPAITSKWNIHNITMETQITDGRVNLKGNFVFREKPKRADYLLYLNANNPIAVVEAKDNNPWGDVLVQMDAEEGVAIAEIDLEKLERIRTELLLQ